LVADPDVARDDPLVRTEGAAGDDRGDRQRGRGGGEELAAIRLAWLAHSRLGGAGGSLRWVGDHDVSVFQATAGVARGGAAVAGRLRGRRPGNGTAPIGWPRLLANRGRDATRSHAPAPVPPL